MTDERSQLLSVHRRRLEQQRRVMNLVGPGDVQVHYEDCDAAIAGLDPEGLWGDLGSGAGFPGVVLAARFPDLEVHLVESRRKRCTFLESVLLEAEVAPPRVRVVHARVETLPDGTYDGIVSRAFAPPAVVLEHGKRLLRSGGRLLLFLQADAEIPHHPDFRLVRTTPYRIGRRLRRVAECERM